MTDAHDAAETLGAISVSSPSAPRPLTPADLPPGTVIDKYRLGNVLGRGGMGLVIAAEHVQLREGVALKFLRIDGEVGSGFRSRFRREAQICAQIKNEHITRVLDIGSYKDTDYMVMEQLTGVDLRGYLKQQSPLGIAVAVDYAVQACEGLAEVHARGVVHRDLKPSNLFVTHRSDGSALIKVLDFGISKWATEMDADEEQLTKTGAVLGSPKYMAPEQLFGSNSVDARADVWSIGAILYEMLVGKPPFEESTFARLCVRISSGEPPMRPRQHRAEIPEELDVAIMLCLERNVSTRLPNVAAVAGELLAAIGDSRAELVRERLQATLDGGAPSSTGERALMRSGRYVAASMSMIAASSSASGSLSSTPAPASTGTVAAVPVAASTPSPDRRKLVIAAMMLCAAIGLLLFVFRRAPETAASTATAPSEPTVSSATSALAPTVAEPTAVAASANAVTLATGPTKHVVQGKVPMKTHKTADTTPSSTPTPTPTVAPPPAPSPVAKVPPKPASPLEDRQ